jgi:hypothetical protein
MNPVDLKSYLRRLLQEELQLSVMMWGAPGIGKSSVVQQLADEFTMGLIDVRLSQLAPSDLRGLPVPDRENSISRWYPPEFLPRSGKGILFLDEVNMAPPTMQGIAQQLILDRKVGSYSVPHGWYIWAAGNRKEDRASVFEMPSPVANRFIHLQVEPAYESFRLYAIGAGLHEQVQSFLAFRPELLFRLNASEAAWPSPRSWEMASHLHEVDLDVATAVGEGAAGEFYTYLDVYSELPNLERIMKGEGGAVPFPSETSVRYAATVGLSVRIRTAKQAIAALQWLFEKASREFTQLYLKNMIPQLRKNGAFAAFLKAVDGNQELDDFRAHMEDLMGTRL